MEVLIGRSDSKLPEDHTHFLFIARLIRAAPAGQTDPITEAN